jgi:hypothetical protein
MSFKAKSYSYKTELETLDYLDQPVGSGKTQAIIKSITDRPRCSHLYVTPTVILAKEIEERMHHDFRDGYLLNSIERVDSSTVEKDETVLENVLASIINAKEQGINKILIVTTATFFNMIQHGLIMSNLRNYHVILDEGIDPSETLTAYYSSPIAHLVNELVIQDGDVIKPAESKEAVKALKAIASRDEDFHSKYAKYASLRSDPDFRTIADRLINGLFDTYGSVTNEVEEEGKGTIRCLALLKPDAIGGFKSVTMIVASFLDTLLANYWQQTHGITMKGFDEKYIDGLFDTHAVKGNLVDIYHVLSAGDNASMTNLKRTINSVPVAEIALNTVSQFFDEEVFLFTLNTRFNLSTEKGQKISPVCAGLDIYRQYNNVAVLSASNPEPWVAGVMNKLLPECDTGAMYRMLANAQAYQIVGRTSLRVRDKPSRIKMVVLSSDIAQYLHEKFEGSTMHGQIGELKSFNTETMKARTEQALVRNNGIVYTTADNSAWSRFKQKCAKQDIEHPLKEDWYKKFRATH